MPGTSTRACRALCASVCRTPGVSVLLLDLAIKISSEHLTGIVEVSIFSLDEK